MGVANFCFKNNWQCRQKVLGAIRLPSSFAKTVMCEMLPVCTVLYCSVWLHWKRIHWNRLGLLVNSWTAPQKLVPCSCPASRSEPNWHVLENIPSCLPFMSNIFFTLAQFLFIAVLLWISGSVLSGRTVTMMGYLQPLLHVGKHRFVIRKLLDLLHLLVQLRFKFCFSLLWNEPMISHHFEFPNVFCKMCTFCSVCAWNVYKWHAS